MTPAEIKAIRELLEKAGYEVMSDGRVFSMTNWRGYGRRELRQHLNQGGYPSVRLLINGRRKRYPVHCLVAEVHICPRPHPVFQVRHLDGSRTNNNVENLRWGSPAANAHDRKRHGTERAAENGRMGAHKISGAHSRLAKLNDRDVQCMRDRHGGGETASRIARDYPAVTLGNICLILKKRTWKHVA